MSEPTPEYGVIEPIVAGVRRLVARNPGALTYHGTNTWLIDTTGGLFVVDPGPADPVHINGIVTAAPHGIAGIVLTHGHDDHCAGTALLQSRTGDRLWPAPPGWERLATPGHTADHACFARSAEANEAGDAVLTGDTVMGWAGGVVEDMAAYMASLRRLIARGGTLYLPGHGPPIPDPAGFTRALLAHRMAREAAIRAMLPCPVGQIVARLYAATPPALLDAARANVVAHLRKIESEDAGRPG